MKLFFCFYVVSLYFDMFVNGRGNISSFLRSFDRNLSQQKDGCSESVNNCTKLSSILANSTCFDLHLNYEYTYENTNFNLNLDNWVAVQAIPQCWNYLQKLLCSIKYPECIHSNFNWQVKKTAAPICLVTKKECPLLVIPKGDENSTQSKTNLDSVMYPLVEQTPSFLDCDLYNSNCLSDTYKRMTPIRDHISCKWPTVKTKQQSLWIKDISKCSFYCQTPFFSREEYQQTKTIFSIFGIIFFLMNIIVLLTLIFHQMQHNEYHWHPLLLNLFIIQIYMVLSTIGWLMPLLPGIGHSIVCRNDGALQIRKPQVEIAEAMWCVVAFSMVYFPLMAGSITSISFFYSILSVVRNYANCCLNKDVQLENCNSSQRSPKMTFLSKRMGFTIRKFDDKINKKDNNIELKEIKPKIDETGIRFRGKGINWEYSVARNQSLSGQVYVLLVSIALLVISLTIAEIRADPVSGICFISSESITTRICLSLLPLTVFLIIKSVIIYFVIRHFRTIQRHLTIYASCQQEIHSKRISRTTQFYVFILLFLWLFWSFSLYSHWYIFVNERSWYGGLTKSFLCNLKQKLLSSLSVFTGESDTASCPLESKPIMNVFILHNLSYFSINIVYIICSIFNRHSILVWKNQVLRCTIRGHSTTEARDLNNLYMGLQNRSLLDALWNPGVFVYLVRKLKKNVKGENSRVGIEEKSATLGSGEDSSASFCVYHQDGSLRSCVSMPPINAIFRQNAGSFSQDLSKNSQIGTTLDDFLKVTQCFIGDNSVRRSNSFAGRPYLNSNLCMNNFQLPSHHGSQNQSRSLVHASTMYSDIQQNNHTSHGYLSRNTPNPYQHNCSSLNRLSHLGNTSYTVSDKINKKSSRRYSMFIDRRKSNGVSSRSTLNRRKRTPRYSLSPKSLSKAMNHQSSISSHHGDPVSCHSSNFSAESYNSYNLMAQQIGGRWRDICRTRMTLHDAMLWAKSASHHNNPMCSHLNMCKHPQCCMSSSLSQHSHHCTPHANIISTTHSNHSNSLTKDLPSDYCGDQEQKSHFTNVPNITQSSKSAIHNSQTSIPLNDDSSDRFNSEDEVVSTGNSVKSTDKASGEFCSEDEVVSLINSDM